MHLLHLVDHVAHPRAFHLDAGFVAMTLKIIGNIQSKLADGQ